MHISIVTLFPELYKPFLETSLVEKAQITGVVSFSLENIFAYCSPKERIDAPSFGHGAGMVLKPEIIQKAVEKQEASYGAAYKIFFSPQGKKLDQKLLATIASELQARQHLMLLPARYEGMDSRVEEYYADVVVSIGDYVLMGGDLPTMVLIEGMLRLIPGVIGKQESVEHESFSGPFVDYPEFTAPVEWKGIRVPDVVRSGNHGQLASWRRTEAARKTVYHHFGWLRSHVKNKEDKKLVASLMPSHYVILMHSHVMVDQNREGNSSVTSLDIHDIARSACSFGIKKYYIITPLLDQQHNVKRLLEFWHTEVGLEYNPQRHEALALVQLVSTLEEAMQEIQKREQNEPLLIATSAQTYDLVEIISYSDQERVWLHKKPVAFVFGTARGLTGGLMNKCNYMLGPIEGFSSFNHLSVRSAVAIVLDRWLGLR
ncbi:tRNA (guanosine(37)-N1)-methyltransferase TrmD [Candidatus Dependentiae bacterium]|nr:tRNA (guanosine(37)-N1)-methyltransferase TrmD [Candidatus Dependentiae bacterium]